MDGSTNPSTVHNGLSSQSADGGITWSAIPTSTVSSGNTSAVAVDPGAVAGAVAAKPGDLVVLWGAGFGTTSPAVAAGTTVSGAPVATTAPTITVGGAQAPVISTVLTTGSAGFYQVTIQIPDTAPAGVVVVHATVGGVTSTDGALMFVLK